MQNYDSAVTEAKTLVKRSEADQWRLAQLTWEQLESGVTGTKWAEDIGVHPSYVYRLYKIWQSHSQSDLVERPGFNEAYKEISPSSAYQPRNPEQASATPAPSAPAPSSPTQLDVLSALISAKQSTEKATRLAVHAGLAGTEDEGITQLADEIAEALSLLIRLNNGVTLEQELESILKGE